MRLASEDVCWTCCMKVPQISACLSVELESISRIFRSAIHSPRSCTKTGAQMKRGMLETILRFAVEVVVQAQLSSSNSRIRIIQRLPLPAVFASEHVEVLGHACMVRPHAETIDAPWKFSSAT